MGAPQPGSPEWMAERCIKTMRDNAPDLEDYDNYLAGLHDPVYIPDNADAEFIAIARRAPLNMIPLVINSVTQVCHVDGIRHSKALDAANRDKPTEGLPPEMVAWQRNRMDARQLPAVQALASHGIVYALTVKDPRNSKLSRFECYTAAQACAVYADPVNDIDPEWGMVIKKGSLAKIEKAHLYTETEWWEITQAKDGLKAKAMGKHGNSVCPLSRAVLHMNLDGEPHGLIEQLKTPQDQINQTSFDVLTTQSWGAFKVRTATGMTVPIRRWTKMDIERQFPPPGPEATPEEVARYNERPTIGDPMLDANGQEIPLPVPMSLKRTLIAEDPDTEFGTLDATDLRPYLSALDARIKYFAAISQTPPTYFMGEMANLSAESLKAAEISKNRRDSEIRLALGEMWERMLQLGMELEGEDDRSTDVGTELQWASTDPSSFAATIDALGKMVEMLDVPPTFAWELIPGMTQPGLVHLHQLREEWENEHPEVKLARTFEQADIFSRINEEPATEHEAA